MDLGSDYVEIDMSDAYLALAWNAVLIFGTAYLVFWRGESGWWFVLAVLLLYSKDEKTA